MEVIFVSLSSLCRLECRPTVFFERVEKLTLLTTSQTATRSRCYFKF